MTTPPSATVERVANRIVRDVAELPDRTSPDDQPDMMLVTAAELHSIVLSALAALPRAPEVQRLAEVAKQAYAEVVRAAIDLPTAMKSADADRIYKQAEAAFRQALAAPPVDVEWVPIDEHARQSGRLLVGWYPDGELGSHVELGIFKASKGWCNTYARPFNGEPDVYMPLPALSRPAAILAPTTKEDE